MSVWTFHEPDPDPGDDVPSPAELRAIARRYERERARKQQQYAAGNPSAHPRAGRRVYQFPEGFEERDYDGF